LPIKLNQLRWSLIEKKTVSTIKGGNSEGRQRSTCIDSCKGRRKQIKPKAIKKPNTKAIVAVPAACPMELMLASIKAQLLGIAKLAWVNKASTKSPKTKIKGKAMRPAISENKILGMNP
jgi:hypothetical protein